MKKHKIKRSSSRKRSLYFILWEEDIENPQINQQNLINLEEYVGKGKVAYEIISFDGEYSHTEWLVSVNDEKKFIRVLNAIITFRGDVLIDQPFKFIVNGREIDSPTWDDVEQFIEEGQARKNPKRKTKGTKYCYVGYPKDKSKKPEIFWSKTKPREKEYPDFGFVEGPFANKKEAENRIRWMGYGDEPKVGFRNSQDKTFSFSARMPVTILFHDAYGEVSADRRGHEKEIFESYLEGFKSSYPQYLKITSIKPIKKNKKFKDAIIDVYEIEGIVKAETQKQANFMIFHSIYSDTGDYYFKTEFPLNIKLEVSRNPYKSRRNPTSKSGILFDINTVDVVLDRIKAEVNAPFVSVSKSILGGKERVAIIFSISLDEKSTWINNIFENSRYGRFDLERDGTLEMFSGWKLKKIKKFRKRKVKSIDDLINTVNNYIASIEESKPMHREASRNLTEKRKRRMRSSKNPFLREIELRKRSTNKIHGFLQDSGTGEIGLMDNRNNKFVIHFKSTKDAERKGWDVLDRMDLETSEMITTKEFKRRFPEFKLNSRRNPHFTVSEVLGLKNYLLENAFIQDFHKGRALIIVIESNIKVLTEKDVDKIWDFIRQNESDILSNYPGKDWIEIESYV